MSSSLIVGNPVLVVDFTTLEVGVQWSCAIANAWSLSTWRKGMLSIAGIRTVGQCVPTLHMKIRCCASNRVVESTMHFTERNVYAGREGEFHMGMGRLFTVWCFIACIALMTTVYLKKASL